MDDWDKDESLEKLSQTAQPSLMREFLEFLQENKKWWLLPILIVIGMVGALAAFGASGAAPFIYTLF